MATYTVLEAAERSGVRRVVNVSSETVPGFSYPRRYVHAGYAPVDECHRIRPQDDRPDASGVSSAKARSILGWEPTRSWRELLDEEGRLRPEVAQRLEAGDTGVHRGLRAIS